MRKSFLLVLLCLFTYASASSQSKAAFEAQQTEKFLGIHVRQFEQPQGLSGFEDLTDRVPISALELTQRPLTGPTPQASYEQRTTVTAKGSDGIIYTGYSGRYGDGKVLPGPSQDSSNANPRQFFAPLYEYWFNPADVFIGILEKGKIKTKLFFRDIGSHDTAPYYFAVDAQGNIHLIVSDVNISDNNELNVYSVVGNPRNGKWTDAVMLDRRGFTSWSHPWAGSFGDSVHLMWDWGDGTYDKNNPNMGLFYVEWTSKGYGRKYRVVRGLVDSYSAAINAKTGDMLVVASIDHRIFVAIKPAAGNWQRPLEILPRLPDGYLYDVSVQAVGGNAFVIRASGRNGYEWLAQPK